MKYYNYFKHSFILFLLMIIFVPNACAIDAGERFEYDIKKLGMTVGSAIFEFKGDTEINGRKVVFIQVTAKGFQFYDQENIYLDRDTFLPLIINRKLDIFGKKETIVEAYDQQKGVVEISGRLEDKEEKKKTIIEHEGAIDNIYGFIYRYRLRGDFEKGEAFDIQLPTKEVSMKLLGEKEIKIDRKRFKAYYMEDIDRHIKVWFGKGEAKVPYKIIGAIGFGKTSLVIKNIN